MGDIVEFTVNGTNGRGYYAPAPGGGPAVLVIQEWWGLVPHIETVCDRFAAAGFSALAPDLYEGETTTEPDEAGKLMMALNLGAASKVVAGAVSFLLADDAVTSSTVGVVGFCMGGGLALVVSCDLGEQVSACAPFYGLIPWEGAEPDWNDLRCPVRGHYAELDGFFGPDAVADLQAKLDAAGVDAQLEVHPGVDHAFFNDTRPEVYDEAAATAAWNSTIDFFGRAIA